MKRILLVANRTACEQHLIDEVRRRRAEGPCTFHLLIPNSHPGGAVWTDEGAELMAHQRLEEALDTLAVAGVTLTGSVGDANPVAAVGDLLRHDTFDEIIVSTLPLGISRWLGQDVVRRMRSAHGLPVTHVVAEKVSVN
jgi:hypothetical protein